jgi:hypothetical protein
LDQVDRLIILEDDCDPSSSFFAYCEDLLKRYEDDERVMTIGGNNFGQKASHDSSSYYFSKYTKTWGWATWRRAWRLFDFEMASWPDFRDSGTMADVCPDPKEAEYWTALFDHVHTGGRDIWDYRWLYACWSQSGLCITPEVNLVSNMGYGPEGTHTRDVSCPLAGIPKQELSRIRHPAFVVADRMADTAEFGSVYGKRGRSLGKRMAGRMKRYLVGRSPDRDSMDGRSEVL